MITAPLPLMISKNSGQSELSLSAGVPKFCSKLSLHYLEFFGKFSKIFLILFRQKFATSSFFSCAGRPIWCQNWGNYPDFGVFSKPLENRTRADGLLGGGVLEMKLSQSEYNDT